jgi:hypothetical protein
MSRCSYTLQAEMYRSIAPQRRFGNTSQKRKITMSVLFELEIQVLALFFYSKMMYGQGYFCYYLVTKCWNQTKHQSIGEFYSIYLLISVLGFALRALCFPGRCYHSSTTASPRGLFTYILCIISLLQYRKPNLLMDLLQFDQAWSEK